MVVRGDAEADDDLEGRQVDRLVEGVAGVGRAHRIGAHGRMWRRPPRGEEAGDGCDGPTARKRPGGSTDHRGPRVARRAREHLDHGVLPHRIHVEGAEDGA